MQGKIDDVRFFNKSLNDDEINRLSISTHTRFNFEVDNVAPVVSSITFTEDNIFDSTLSNDSSAYVLAKGDNVELIFRPQNLLINHRFH